MFDYSELIKQALIDPNQVWRALDSFWRTHTEPTTKDLEQYQTWASTLLFLNTQAKWEHFLTTQAVPTVEPFMRQPWFPIVLYQDRLIDQSLFLYGEGFLYSPVPQISYGEQSVTPRYVYPLPQELRFTVDIPFFVDAVTNTTVQIDQTQFSYSAVTGDVVFTVDPFSLITPKTSSDGRDYIILWVRNILFDLDVPFDQVGWVVKYDRASLLNYAETLQEVWDLVLRGPSLSRYKKGLLKSLGFPYALSDGQITRIDDDGYQWVISTGDKSYTAIKADASPAVIQGQTVVEGQPLTDGVKFFEYPDLLTATAAELSGLLLQIPLSNGVVAPLSFANITTAWDFDAGRPSPWRFPVGGDLIHVEQFWVDVDTYATANAIDFATLYGLPAAVNPMRRIIEDLFHNSVFVASVDLDSIGTADPGGFADRARLLLPTDVLIVLQQNLPAISDEFDLGVTSSETVGYGYNAAIPKEDLSVTGSGTSLEYTDYAPAVFTW